MDGNRSVCSVMVVKACFSPFGLWSQFTGFWVWAAEKKEAVNQVSDKSSDFKTNKDWI